MQTEYLLLIFGSFLIPAVYILIHRRFLARTYRLYFINLSVVLASIPFVVWDIYATAANYWHFNPRYTLSLSLAGLPLEEYLFFLLIPQSCLLIWIAFNRYTSGHSLINDLFNHVSRFRL